jgi:hypothetical protein
VVVVVVVVVVSSSSGSSSSSTISSGINNSGLHTKRLVGGDLYGIRPTAE